MQALKPYLLLAALVLAFFGPLVLHPTHTLYADRSDLLAMHLPNKAFLVRSWRETGEIPLWNPYAFAGMPFAQDMQVAAFYPLYSPLYFMPEDWLGPAMSWLVVLHVMIAGWCAYAHASAYLADAESDVGPFHGVHLGAFVAALGYAFAGKWLLHLLAGGHFPMLGLAWVPLVLFFLERAIRRRSWLEATWAGAAFALIILGSHPQVMFYSGLFVALWTLGPALQRAGWMSPGWPSGGATLRSMAAWIGAGAWTVIVAGSLAAVQLLPNLAIISHATRAQGLRGLESLEVAAWKATELMGPPLAEPTWEERGGFALLWVIMAGMGLALRPRRFWYLALTWLVVLGFGLGGSAFLEGLPGFAYFRLPGRILWFAALPIAILAGSFMQTLLAAPGEIVLRAGRCRVVLLATLLLVGMLVVLGWMAVRQMNKVIAPSAMGYWLIALIAAFATYVFLHRPSRTASRWLGFAAVSFLVVDLWALSWPHLATRPAASVLEPSDCVMDVRRRLRDGGRVLDRDVDNQPGATPLGYAFPALLGIEPVRGWHSLDVRWYKEFVQFISDVDEPVGPRDLINNFPIRNKQLLDVLAVQYVLQPQKDVFPGKVERPFERDTRWRRVSEDLLPQAFGVINAGGRRSFPPYATFANLEAMPRAFVVGAARPLAERTQVLDQLRSTDLRRVVLLEGNAADVGDGPIPEEPWGQAEIRIHQPNRLELDVSSKGPGWLVLADVWYPGWLAWVNDQPTPVLRANHALRAIRVPGGDSVVTMVMRPSSYFWGKVVSCLSLAGLAALLACRVWRRCRPRPASL